MLGGRKNPFYSLFSPINIQQDEILQDCNTQDSPKKNWQNLAQKSQEFPLSSALPVACKRQLPVSMFICKQKDRHLLQTLFHLIYLQRVGEIKF